MPLWKELALSFPKYKEFLTEEKAVEKMKLKDPSGRLLVNLLEKILKTKDWSTTSKLKSLAKEVFKALTEAKDKEKLKGEVKDNFKKLSAIYNSAKEAAVKTEDFVPKKLKTEAVKEEAPSSTSIPERLPVNFFDAIAKDNFLSANKSLAKHIINVASGNILGIKAIHNLSNKAYGYAIYFDSDKPSTKLEYIATNSQLEVHLRKFHEGNPTFIEDHPTDTDHKKSYLKRDLFYKTLQLKQINMKSEDSSSKKAFNNELDKYIKSIRELPLVDPAYLEKLKMLKFADIGD